jgi:hypothetical protein
MSQTGAGVLRGGRWGRTLVHVAGFMFYLLAVQAVLTGAVGVSVFAASHKASDLALPAVSFLLAGSYALVGFHLRRQRLWARNFAFAFAAFSLFAFPVGTGIGLFITVCVAVGNRAGVFPRLRRVPLEEYPLIRFEPELVAEQAG